MAVVVLAIIGVTLMAAIWLVILRQWEYGLYLLLGYIPFAGLVTVQFYPSRLPLLFKDVFLILPTYLGFCLFHRARPPQVPIPRSIVVAMLALAAIVTVHAFNPDVPNWIVAAIGVKVWLFYLPMIFLGSAILRSRERLVTLLRIMAAIAWVPCAIGLALWFGSMTIGYEETMLAFYGEAAEAATQGFERFELGGILYRIPSTFTYPLQYFGYALSMIVVTYILMKVDPSPRWRRFATVTLAFVIVASFLSGIRAAFLFVPLLLVLCYLIEGNLVGIMRLAVVLPALLYVALRIGGIDPAMLFNMMLELTAHYSETMAYGGPVRALQNDLLGRGTGMNTGPARYAFPNPADFTAIESYYAKAIYELGVSGLMIVIALFLLLIGCGVLVHFRLHCRKLRSCSAAIIAFMMTIVLNSFKGWQIDLDPINVYFWLFSGFLFQLKHLDVNPPETTDVRPGNRGAKAVVS